MKLFINEFNSVLRFWLFSYVPQKHWWAIKRTRMVQVITLNNNYWIRVCYFSNNLWALVLFAGGNISYILILWTTNSCFRYDTLTLHKKKFGLLFALEINEQTQLKIIHRGKLYHSINSRSNKNTFAITGQRTIFKHVLKGG